MLLTRKKSGEVKGQLVYNGKETRNWISCEDKSSPTVLAESLMLTCAVDAFERRDIMTLDIPNAYIQASVPLQEVGNRIIMKVRDDLVEWLCQIDPVSYTPYVVVERKAKVLYLQVTRAIYGMLQAGLFWYRKFQNDLEEVGFVFNDYDPCVANQMRKGEQHTIRYHVDDVLLSHVDAGVNDGFSKWCQSKYGNLKDILVCCGKIHQFLGMTLDFSMDGECRVKQFEHVDDMIESFPEELGEKEVKTPASNHLYEGGEGLFLSDEKREVFYSIVARGIFVGGRSRPGIIPTVSVLSGCIHEPKDSDWNKLKQLVGYLKSIRELF